MTFMNRIRQAFKLTSDAMATVNDMSDVDQIGKAIDALQQKQTMAIDIGSQEKEYNPNNRLQIYRNQHNLLSFYTSTLGAAVHRTNGNNVLENIPPDDPGYDFVLDGFWKKEPILAGAVYSMSAKMSSLSWTVMGTRRKASYYANVLSNSYSMNGVGWGDTISSTAQDYYTLNRGSFWHTLRSTRTMLDEIAYMDALSCAMTGNMMKPVYYSSEVTGQQLYLDRTEYAHFVSMPSSRERNMGLGFCAVARAYKAARILMALSNYDWEKLNNLPPEGVAAVTGLTKDEFLDSLELWRTARASNNSLTYPQVLWLLGSQPNTAVGIDFVGFSQIPESFDRNTVVPQYVNVLALVFGVDAREFWPISSGALGTASETEIQHMKAKGKGPGEFISTIERWMNNEFQPDVEFGFDTQDVGEDQLAASIAKGWIDALMPLYVPGSKGTPPSKTPMAPGVTRPEGGASQSNLTQPENQNASAEPLITKDQLLRLLVDRRVLPNWVIEDNKVIQTDTGIMQKMYGDVDSGDDPVVITWKEGVLDISRHPAYNMLRFGANGIHIPAQTYSNNGVENNLGTSELEYKGGASSENDKELTSPITSPNIQGVPIPKQEELRGPRITHNTIKAELDLWLATPELSAYVPTPDEEEYTTILRRVK